MAQAKQSNEKTLSRQEKSIVGISALTATGNFNALSLQLKEGLNAGLNINEVKEILVQFYAYCGFPRSLNALTTFMKVLEERRAKGIYDTDGKTATPIKDTDKYKTGKSILQKLTRKEEHSLTGTNAFAPPIDTFLKEHLFADIFIRDVLNYQQRELATVSTLAAMTDVSPQLRAHIRMAMNTGIMDSQILDAFLVIDRLIGKSHGNIAREAFLEAVREKK